MARRPSFSALTCRPSCVVAWLQGGRADNPGAEEHGVRRAAEGGRVCGQGVQLPGGRQNGGNDAAPQGQGGASVHVTLPEAAEQQTCAGSQRHPRLPLTPALLRLPPVVFCRRSWHPRARRRTLARARTARSPRRRQAPRARRWMLGVAATTAPGRALVAPAGHRHGGFTAQRFLLPFRGQSASMLAKFCGSNLRNSRTKCMARQLCAHRAMLLPAGVGGLGSNSCEPSGSAWQADDSSELLLTVANAPAQTSSASPAASRRAQRVLPRCGGQARRCLLWCVRCCALRRRRRRGHPRCRTRPGRAGS